MNVKFAQRWLLLFLYFIVGICHGLILSSLFRRLSNLVYNERLSLPGQVEHILELRGDVMQIHASNCAPRHALSPRIGQSDSPLQFDSVHPQRLQLSSVVVSKHELCRCYKNLEEQFSRFKFLRSILDGEVKMLEMHPIIALVLGFRIVNEVAINDGCQQIQESQASQKRRYSVSDIIAVDDGTFPCIYPNSSQLVQIDRVLKSPQYVVRQVSSVAPLGWEDFDDVPNLLNVTDKLVFDRLMSDLPAKGLDQSTDAVIESLVGQETCMQLKLKRKKESQMRLLLVKWLYTHNFIGEDFPNQYWRDISSFGIWDEYIPQVKQIVDQYQHHS